MQKNLSEFADNYEGKKSAPTDNSSQDLLSTYNKYKGASQDTLISALLQNIDKQKKDGTFDKNELLKTLNKVEPLLNDKQKELLDKVLKMI